MNPVPPRSDYHSRPLPTTPDRSYGVGSSRTPSRREPPPIPPYSHGGTVGVSQEWQPRSVDDPVRRELEEARARTAQMEKTMRWWSDCTANWREKWSKAREERNHAREECRRLRSELDMSTAECGTLSQHRDRLVAQVHALQQELTLIRSSSLPTTAQGNNIPASDSVGDVSEPTGLNDTGTVDANGTDVHCVSLPQTDLQVSELKVETDTTQLSVLQKELQDANTIIESKNRELDTLSKVLNELKLELADMTAQRSEVIKSEQDARLEVEKLKKWKHERIEQMASDIEDETPSGSDIDRRLVELRRELEKLQAENAQEWAQREKLSSEKLALERENKRLKIEISRLEEELSRQSRSPASVTVADLNTRMMQEDLASKTKELTELRHAHARTKKSLQDRTAELEHARSRAEQYEAEVKKLRLRIEELKRELATAEDECDQQTNQVRRLHRANEELQQQTDGLTVQLLHLQNRLQRPKQDSELSAGNSSEDLVTNDLSENDVVEEDDGNVE